MSVMSEGARGTWAGTLSSRIPGAPGTAAGRVRMSRLASLCPAGAGRMLLSLQCVRGHKAGSADQCGLEGQEGAEQQVQAGRKALLLPLPLSGHPRSGNKHFRIR